MVRISFQGEPGAYSEAAAKEIVGEKYQDAHTFVGREGFDQVFEDVIEGRSQFGVVPIENTLGGSVHANYDNLLRYASKVYINTDHDFRVRHCLLALPNVHKDSIKKVISHPQALAQCAVYLRTQFPNAVRDAVYDTAGAAKMIQEGNLNDTAAISSELAAKHYKMNIVARDIQDVEFNVTRFLLISKNPCILSPSLECNYGYDMNTSKNVSGYSNGSTGGISSHSSSDGTSMTPLIEMKKKTSLCFWVPHCRGALLKAVSAFSLREVNMTKVESRPVPARFLREFLAEEELRDLKYQYCFYVDVEGNQEDFPVKCAINHLREISPFVKVFSSYPTGRVLTPEIEKVLRGKHCQKDDYDTEEFEGGNSLGGPSSERNADGRGSFVLAPATKKRKMSDLMLNPYGTTQRKINHIHIAIFGFGTFGQFLAKKFLSCGHTVSAYSRSSYETVCEEMGVIWCDTLERLVAINPDIILVSTSILVFEKSIVSLAGLLTKDIVDSDEKVGNSMNDSNAVGDGNGPVKIGTAQKKKFSNLLSKGGGPFSKGTGDTSKKKPLIVDVCSVKVHPREVMLKILPREVEILCTHPMFGPESARYGWTNLTMMYEKVRVSEHESSCNTFLDIFEKAGCDMQQMNCEQHDKYAASSQFLTHFTGRILGAQNVEKTPIDTMGFKGLLKLSENTCKDSWDLFCGLYVFNKNSAEQIEKFGTAFEKIQNQILDFEKARLKSVTEGVVAGKSPTPRSPIRRISSPKNQRDQVRKVGSTEGSPGESQMISCFARDLRPSKTVSIHALTKRLEAEGVPVIGSLCVGEPDFPPAQAVLDALKEGVNLHKTRYTAVGGTIELRKAICNDLETRKGVKYTPEQVVVSNGGKQGIYQAFLAVLEPGDEVIVPTPCWTSYFDLIRMCKATPVGVERNAKDGYALDVSELFKRVTSRTKIIVLCSPCNPTGAVFPNSVLHEIAKTLRENKSMQHIKILADEIYEALVYDNLHTCFAALPGMKERTLLINGFSKSHAMTGLRLGYLCAPLTIAEACTKIQSQLTSCASSLAQYAAVAALTKVPKTPWLQERLAELKAKRDYVVKELRKHKHLTFKEPQGAFYCLPDITGYLDRAKQQGGHNQIDGKNADADSAIITSAKIITSEEFCKVLLEKYHLALVPGEAFQAPGTVRISYATSMRDLKKAMSLFAEFLQKEF